MLLERGLYRWMLIIFAPIGKGPGGALSRRKRRSVNLWFLVGAAPCGSADIFHIVDAGDAGHSKALVCSSLAPATEPVGTHIEVVFKRA